MSSTTHRRSNRRAHPTFSECLVRLADILAADVDDHSRVAIGVVPDGDGVELHLRPFVTDDPATELADIEALPEWKAFGVATGGTARSLDDRDAQRSRVRLVVFVDRTGRAVSAITGQDAILDTRPATPDSNPLSHGRIPDACRRVLALPTDPPPLPTSALLVFQWINNLVTAGMAQPGQVTWDQAVDLIPDLTRTSWTDLRLATADGALSIEGVDPHVAAWMDDGMFARESLASFPPMSLMCELLMETLPPETTAAIINTIRAHDLFADSSEIVPEG